MTIDFFSQILERKEREVEKAKRTVSERALRELAEARTDRRPFFERLAAPAPYGVNIIAEIKRASPSRGPIRKNLQPGAYARAYESGKATALSVLTERTYFRARPRDLAQAREATALPVMRKDFLISTYQIYESVVMGADAVLLIVRALPPSLLKDCVTLCNELRIDPLVEVHSQKELETATWAQARLIGINNRDLKTFQTDINHCIRLSRYLEPTQIAVAESGIAGRAYLDKIRQAGLWNFLIGESLLTTSDPEGFLRHLLGS